MRGRGGTGEGAREDEEEGPIWRPILCPIFQSRTWGANIWVSDSVSILWSRYAAREPTTTRQTCVSDFVSVVFISNSYTTENRTQNRTRNRTCPGTCFGS